MRTLTYLNIDIIRPKLKKAFKEPEFLSLD